MRREEIEVLKAILDEALSYDEDEICLTYDEAVLLTDFFTKLLEQEPCEDAISRQVVLDEMYRRKANGDSITAGFIRDLPPVTSQPKWIPVSERLPEESLNSVIGWDTYRERCVFVQYINSCFQITGSDESFDIVAWMPLPAPYKAESEE